MDDAVKKEALRLFTYGLYAVSVRAGGQANAFTANWLSQVSFDPPLVALSVDNTAASLAMIREARRFVVNVFGAEQRELSGKLGKTLSRSPDKLNGIAFGETASGQPYLSDTLGWVEVAIESETPAGDSTLLLGRVVDAGMRRHGEEPLTMRAAGFKHAG
ncbi:MAG TPA: flavin reductase family protein [Ktedonobacterales bacterium]|jgi:flavin reductase (DIM6/NTAB) family NADH-FMN oxidoreductase RutF|nr:flavin reductase family protein [Ktedonobacterales bacterium]